MLALVIGIATIPGRNGSEPMSTTELSMAISRRPRALSQRHADMSRAEFAWLVMGWGAAVAGVLVISLLVRFAWIGAVS